MLENDYLQMANHAKEMIDEKDKIIEFLKNKMDNIEDNLRSMEYKISNMTYLTKYKKKADEDNGFDFYADCILGSLKECYEIVDVARQELQTDEDDDHIIMMLNIADESDSSSSTDTT